MNESFEFVANNLTDTDKIAKLFAKAVKEGAFVCLTGEIGAGKTAFVKFVCKYLDVKQKVTSPSFVILNEYKSGVLPIYHFDLYRLENTGIESISGELEEYSYGKILTFVEWAEFSTDLPFDRLVVNIDYLDDNKRKFTFSAFGERSECILTELFKQ